MLPLFQDSPESVALSEMNALYSALSRIGRDGGPDLDLTKISVILEPWYEQVTADTTESGNTDNHATPVTPLALLEAAATGDGEVQQKRRQWQQRGQQQAPSRLRFHWLQCRHTLDHDENHTSEKLQDLLLLYLHTRLLPDDSGARAAWSDERCWTYLERHAHTLMPAARQILALCNVHRLQYCVTSLQR